MIQRHPGRRLPVRPPAPRRLLPVLLVALAPVWVAAPSTAQPVLGFREEFSAPGVGGWSGGIAAFNNPGTGGLNGSGDGYLFGTRTTSGNWGLRCTGCPEYSGNWTAAGITQVRLWLDDVGADHFFEIHVQVGSNVNFWQYNIGFVPPEGRWAEFVVDLTSPGDYTQTIGSGTFAEALEAVDILQVRHDEAPFMQTPDLTLGDLGIDGILLTNGIVGIQAPGLAGKPIRLAAPYPNPSRGAVTFALEVFDEGPVALRIVDVSGRLVRSIELPPGGAGPRTWMWDGRDASGNVVSPGAYRVLARGRAGGTSRSFVRVR
jgi:hypothetical protein